MVALWCFVKIVPAKPKDQTQQLYYLAKHPLGWDVLELNRENPNRPLIWWQQTLQAEPAEFEITSDGDGWSGSYLQQERNRETNQVSLFHGKISPDQQHMQAITPRGLELAFQQMAHARRLEIKHGFRLLNRGTSAEFSTEYPQFHSTNRFTQALNRFIEQKALAILHAAETNIWSPPEWREELRQAWAGPQYTSKWNCWQKWRIIHVSSNLTSLIMEYYDYTGGAHGMYSVTTWNLAWDGHRIHELDIHELFKAGAAWQPLLVRLCTEQLTRLEASSVVSKGSKALAYDFWQKYTVSAEGLRFYFDPYDVASWAEGRFTLLIRWEEMQSVLNPEKVRHFQ